MKKVLLILLMLLCLFGCNKGVQETQDWIVQAKKPVIVEEIGHIFLFNYYNYKLTDASGDQYETGYIYLELSNEIK